MGMGPNDTELVRVYTREAGRTIADLTLPVTADGEVVVQAEAGSAIHSTGAQFDTNIVVRDLTANDVIAANPAAGFSGQMKKAAWPNLDQEFVYTIPAANLTGRENHLCQVITFLTVGIGPNQDASFAESALFIVTA
jgi:hypothetical protein